MKIAAAEALWNTEQPCGFSLFQIGGFTARRPDAELRHRGTAAALVPRHRLVRRRGAGHQRAQRQYQQQYGPGNYIPPSQLAYWACAAWRTSARSMFLVARSAPCCTGGGRLERTRWFLWTAVVAIAFPFLAATSAGC